MIWVIVALRNCQVEACATPPLSSFAAAVEALALAAEGDRSHLDTRRHGQAKPRGRSGQTQ